MEHASMVHALDEIRRTLKPSGILLDLRPVEDNWSVEVHSATDLKIAGYLTDVPIGKSDDEAAFAAMRDVESRGWFVSEQSEEFAFFYYWNTPSEMKEWIDSEWEDFEKIEEDVYRKTQSLWASANADARVRVRVKMLITRWRRANPEWMK
jgi:SAM-dependent methyltransferase